MIGADTQELLGLQAGMIRASGSLQQIADALMPQLATTTWHGSDRIQFETRLGEARASLTQVSEQMRAKAGELGGHAEEQDRASEPDSTSATFSMRSLRDHLRRAQESDSLDEVLRQLFGASGDATPGSLGGFEDPNTVRSRSIGVDFETIDEFDPGTVVQGNSFGNCWFLATLAAVAEQNPALIADKIKLIRGETPADDYWEVSLYADGEWITHTVTQDELVKDGVRERQDHPDDSYSEHISWMSIYERAAVEHVGGDYGDLEANFAGKGFEMITGDDGSLHLTGDFDDIRNDLEDGRSVVTSTPPGWLLGGAPDGDIVDGHVYIVEEIKTNEEGEEVIVLINPWGKPDGSRPHTVELTQQEYLNNFVSRNSVGQ